MVARGHKTRYVPIVLLGLCVTLLGAGSVALVRGFLNSAPGQPKKVVQEIHVIRPPPPPPDLPPPPPPPPEEKVDMQELQKPDPTPSNDPPPSQQLGLDTEGGAGGDAFGLVGNKGGRELLASGGSASAWYGALIKSEILSCLNDVKTRSSSQPVDLRVWVRDDGTVDRVHIMRSSGNAAWDKAIDSALSGTCRVPQSPPADMPQPVSVRIVSRG